MIDDNRKDLKEYFKFVYKCHFCKKQYGADVKEKHLVCPVCQLKIINGKTKEEKRKLLLKSETKDLNTK